MNTLCSIVIPVYNRAGLTRRCLDTLLDEQPEVPFEIVVVDDGSTDSTAQLLSGYGGSIRVITHAVNRGYASACNDGAAAATGENLIFLNNDTLPKRGWLDALLLYAQDHPEAAVVGSKLLFPNDTIQHAGVIFNQEASPRHIYSGFPADHPAVNKSRRFQCVTFACALIRRPIFDELGGLDDAFRNSYEDVDFCLRLAQRDFGEVHYCHESVLYHLESVSRGRISEDDDHNARLLTTRWLEGVERDDLRYYQEDKLLRIFYPENYPLRVEISPVLAMARQRGRKEETKRLLDTRSREVFRLLEETIRLTAYVADLEIDHEKRAELGPPEGKEIKADKVNDLFTRIRDLEQLIDDLQRRLALLLGDSSNGASGKRPFAPSPYLSYGIMLWRIRETVNSALPEGTTLAVVSDGNDDFLELDGREAFHFPQNEEGIYTGRPPDSRTAIYALEDARIRGAEYLLLPVTLYWWIQFYEEFFDHIERNYMAVFRRDDACMIFSLKPR